MRMVLKGLAHSALGLAQRRLFRGGGLGEGTADRAGHLNLNGRYRD